MMMVAVATKVLLVVSCCYAGGLAKAARSRYHGHNRKRDCGDVSNSKNPANSKMVVFGDSLSDRRRRFDAPASFQFEGIGVFPWKDISAANDTEDMVDAYIRGSATNGKAWAEWLGVDKELNFATGSASMTESFRSREICTGYTGEGEDFPTGTFDEQINLYLHDVVSKTSSTLGHTHVIIFGANDILRLFDAFTRYAIGLALEDSGALEEPYKDPVPYENVFEIVDLVPQLTLDPLLTDFSTALSDGVARLLEGGVTGRILVGNVASIRGTPGDPERIDFVDSIILTVNEEVSAVVESNEQLRLLDMYTTTASIVNDPDVWTKLGFVAPEDEETGETLPFGTPCFQSNFKVDYTAEIMGTQALRPSDCQAECAICANDISPCETCYIGNPSATICDNPDTRFFWDSVHPTTAVHSLLAQAIRECSEEKPNYDQPIVKMLCPRLV